MNKNDDSNDDNDNNINNDDTNGSNLMSSTPLDNVCLNVSKLVMFLFIKSDIICPILWDQYMKNLSAPC